VEPLPDDIDTSPAAVVALAGHLLDQGLPFQAHEALEAAWKASPDRERPAWQALAQLAVALTHCLRGNRVGAARLRARALDNLHAGELPTTASALRDRLLALTDGC
jgi:predicted metal-dependent hydrolase